MPATIGETEKGSSIIEIISLRPGNSKRATAQAVAMPKTMLTGTTMTAVSTVRKIACSVSGCTMFAA